MAEFDLIIEMPGSWTGQHPGSGGCGVRTDDREHRGDPRRCSRASEIDARDEVRPGFVDMHTHNDFLLKDPASVSKLQQGVTTIFIGQCSISPSPTGGKAASRTPIAGSSRRVEPEWN
ncbi:hypothetical protein MASR2M79_09830 [Aminivibrio sp.]